MLRRVLSGLIGWSLLAWTSPAAVVQAVAPTTQVFFDRVDGDGPSILQTFVPPEATIVAEWNGGRLAVLIDTPDHSVFHTIHIAPASGQALAPGTYTDVSSLDVDGTSGIGCDESVTVSAIDPVPQPGIPLTALTTLSASFSHDCGVTDIRGEIRIASTDPIAALGYDGVSMPAYGLALNAGESFVGRTSTPTTLTLRNRGTAPLTFGAMTLDPASAARWSVTGSTCAGATLAVGATCTITAQALEWVPGYYLEDGLTIAVPIGRGLARVGLSSRSNAARFVPIEPVRLVDTRTRSGITSVLRHGVARTFTVIDRTPLDAARNIPVEAVAVVGNLTVVGQTSGGYLALTETATAGPTTSTVNAPMGDIRANGAIVRLAANGTAGLTWVGSAGSKAHAVFDATGYFVPTTGVSSPRSGNFKSYAPTRVLDSRIGLGFSGKLRPRQPRTFSIPLVGVDAEATALAGNLTVVRATGAGYVTISPLAQTTPTTSTLNFPAGDTRANNVITKLSPTKTLSITYVGPAGTSVDAVFDVVGLFGPGSSQAGFVPLVPNRVVDSRTGLGLAARLKAQTVRRVDIANRHPTDPSRNIPPDSSTGSLLFKEGYTTNVTFIAPNAAGYLAVLPVIGTTPPATSTVNAPKGDIRANGAVVAWAGERPIDLAFWYEASAGALTHVAVDVTGYFLLP